MVKGLGIGVLKQRQVIPALEAACTQGTPLNRQGALFAFECLCDRLKMLFEPYVIVILPLLLKCFSDGSEKVRKAAHGASRSIMANLSQHGVKLVLPKILEAMSETAWRTKQASTQLLGAMAYCAPRQLGSCLPQIVPKLTEAFTDTHPKVRESAKKALRDVRSVVRNPEVSSLSEVLLAALTEPSKHTKSAIEALLACEFIHSIDAPSLALLVPVLHRGMKDRSADTKRKASLITGNMCSMISDAKDMAPYLPQLLPGLQETVLDPIPDVRGTAAKALGQLVYGMGKLEDEIVPWLLTTLKTAPSSVERSGAAQGLSEIMTALPEGKRGQLLADLLPLASHPTVGIREGLLWLLSFLPLSLGNKNFAPWIASVLPVVLQGLADQVESVREVAMRAGQVMVKAQGKAQLGVLLPALEAGLSDDNWRIRQSSVQLLGDLLYLICGTKAIGVASSDLDVSAGSGASATADLGDDEFHGNARAAASLAATLGPERRASILAALYMLRSDMSMVVRNCTLQVWKSMVVNTPRTLREILPTILDQIIKSLASGNVDKRTVAGRALGDVVNKLGERVLPIMVPFLQENLRDAPDVNTRQGVCLGLAEVLQCASRKQIQDYQSSLVSTVHQALCDEAPEVRQQAAIAFQTLFKVVGMSAVDDVLPRLVKQAVSDSDEDRQERALFGLCQVLRSRGRELLPVVVPRFLVSPMSHSHAHALGTIAEVTGDSIHHMLHKILPVLASELADADQEAKSDVIEASVRRDALFDCGSKVVSVVESGGVHWLGTELIKLMSAEEAGLRKWGLRMLEAFFKGNTSCDYVDQVPLFLKEMSARFTDQESEVLEANRDALMALVKARPMEEFMNHLEFLRNLIVSLVSDAKHRKGASQDQKNNFMLPAFNVTKGIEPLLIVYQHALQNGSPLLREVAASGIGEMVELTDAAFLKPFLIKVTGPLIRVVGDRFPSGVKAAILTTLRLLLDKGARQLKPFVPQLQTSFVKALSDDAKAVRDRGAKALGQLMEMSNRVDPVIGDLVVNASNPANSDHVRESILTAIAEVFSRAGTKVSPGAREKARLALVKDCLSDPKEPIREAAARAVAAVAAHEDNLEGIIGEMTAPLFDGQRDGWELVHGYSLALGAIAVFPAAKPLWAQVIAGLVAALKGDQHGAVKADATRSLGMVLKEARKEGFDAVDVTQTLAPLAAIAAHESADVRVNGLDALKQAGKACPSQVRAHLGTVVPPILSAVRGTNIRVKMAGERALLHVLEIHTRTSTLDEVVATSDVSTARFVRDYARRVLMRLAPDSGDEDE